MAVLIRRRRGVGVRKVPQGARPGGTLNPERFPVIPRVPGTRDKGLKLKRRRRIRSA